MAEGRGGEGAQQISRQKALGSTPLRSLPLQQAGRGSVFCVLSILGERKQSMERRRTHHLEGGEPHRMLPQRRAGRPTLDHRKFPKEKVG